MEIGLNVMSSITPMREDFESCVRKLKEGGCGFFEVMSDWGAKEETINYYAGFTGGPSEWDPENTEKRLAVLQKYGMDIRGMFVFNEKLPEQADEMGKYCLKNGIRYIFFSFLQYGNIDDIYKKISLTKQISAAVSKYGVKVLMHNHENDLLPVTDRDGREKPILDIFLEQCSASELMLEADTGWLKYAGLNEVKYVEEHLNRIAVLHLKDLCKNYKTISPDDIFVVCGKGCVNFPEIMKIARKKPDILLVLDQDASKGDIIDDSIASIHYFKNHFCASVPL